jgi:hypothetical protein
VSGNLIPNVNTSQTSSFNLGQPNAIWKALYVATKSIHFMDDVGNEVANISVERRGNTPFINTGDVISYDSIQNIYAGIVAEAATGLVLLGDYNRILANPVSLTMDQNIGTLYMEGSASGASGLQVDFQNDVRPVVSLGDFNKAGNSTSLILNDVSKTITTSGSFIISGSLDVSKGITGSLQGVATTASYVLQAVSASFATTASYAANISSYNVTQSFSNSSTWTFNHNLGYKSVIVQAYDSSDAQIIPQNIVLTNANTATITFPTNETGYAVATVGGTLALATSSFAQNAVTASFVTPYEGAWTSYTPVWTANSSNPVIGNGTLEGWYKVIGKTCFVRGNIVMGTTTTFGSGEWYVSMPFTASHADAILMTANLLDNGSAWYNATVNGARAGFNYKAPLQYQAVGGTANDVNATSPFTWASTDRFLWNGSYEIA